MHLANCLLALYHFCNITLNYNQHCMHSISTWKATIWSFTSPPYPHIEITCQVSSRRQVLPLIVPMTRSSHPTWFIKQQACSLTNTHTQTSCHLHNFSRLVRYHAFFFYTLLCYIVYTSHNTVVIMCWTQRTLPSCHKSQVSPITWGTDKLWNKYVCMQ